MAASHLDFFDNLDVGPDEFPANIRYQELSDGEQDDEKKSPPSDVIVPLQGEVAIANVSAGPAEDRLLTAEEKEYVERHAYKNSMKYYHRYWPADGSFTPALSVINYWETGNVDFDPTMTFSMNEMAKAYIVFCLIFPLYYFIHEILDGESPLPAAWNSKKFGWQFWFFYFLDRDFGESLDDIAFTCFLMGALVYLLDTIPDLLMKYKYTDQPGMNAVLGKQMLKISIRNIGEAVAVTVGTAIWWGPYFIPLDGFLGMLIRGLLSGLASNAGAFPFVKLCEAWDIADDLKSGELVATTVEEEAEEEKMRPSLCTRATNYFCHGMFGARAANDASRQAFLTQQERADGEEVKVASVPDKAAPFLTRSKWKEKPLSASKSKSREGSEAKEGKEHTIEMHNSSREKVRRHSLS